MKIFLTSAVLFLSLSALAQYHPFPTDSAVWVNYAEHFTNEPNPIPDLEVLYVNNFCASGEDTTINAIDYKVIDVCHANGSYYFGAIRYNSGQVYFVPTDSLNEHLLYDFTLNAGESAEVLIMHPSEAQYATFGLHTVTVNNVNTVIVNGTSRKSLEFGGYVWIEGIGCTSGLFSEVWENVSNYYLQLKCMSYQDTIHYENWQPLAVGYAGSCPMTVGIQETLPVEAWNIYPNPANDFIQITSEPGELKDVLIYDAFGRLVLSGYETEKEIPITTLEEGIYYAEVDHSVRLKFLVSN